MPRFELSENGILNLSNVMSKLYTEVCFKNVYYLIGSISGVDGAERIFNVEREVLDNYLKTIHPNNDYIILDYYYIDKIMTGNTTYIDRMIISDMVLKSLVDFVVLIDNSNWVNSRGTLSELSIAATNNIEVLHMSDIHNILDNILEGDEDNG